MLAFDPFDHDTIYGQSTGAATIGGVVAASVSGSRRVSAGGVRDHVLGFRAVSGLSEAFIAGVKVVKNVTGYDLPKLMTGSWGRLVAYHAACSLQHGQKVRMRRSGYWLRRAISFVHRGKRTFAADLREPTISFSRRSPGRSAIARLPTLNASGLTSLPPATSAAPCR